jgi:hypothetical protein
MYVGAVYCALTNIPADLAPVLNSHHLLFLPVCTLNPAWVESLAVRFIPYKGKEHAEDV